MKKISEIIKEKPYVGWLFFLATMAAVFVLGLFASNVMERRTEAQFIDVPKTKIKPFESRNEVWGENYPTEFELYYQTADTTFQSYAGGGKMRDVLAEDPRLVVLWAGYAFSKDYNQGRGHYYAVEDVYNTLRTGAPMNDDEGPQPTTCWTCKSPDVPRVMQRDGIDEYFKGKWARLGNEIVNPIGCADCHDPETMDLIITRPHLVEAYKACYGKDISEATHNEMRSLVCAQCHVEYYFDKKRVDGAAFVKLPWEKGLTVENMEEYYDNIAFTDYVHGLSKTPILKAQHPDFELYSMGIHGQRGVSCADCHMPYKRVGSQKFSDHKIQSPLNNMANSCQVCHREDAETLVANVYERQKKVAQVRVELEDLLVKAHVEAKLAWDKGATEKQMEPILRSIRQAQWRWDYVAASHGGSFHAPLESVRVLSNGLVKAQDARVQMASLLAQLGQTGTIEYPDISTKDKAQKYIGLDIEKERAAKAEFKRTIVPKWLEEAKQKGLIYDKRKS